MMLWVLGIEHSPLRKQSGFLASEPSLQSSQFFLFVDLCVSLETALISSPCCPEPHCVVYAGFALTEASLLLPLVLVRSAAQHTAT